MTKDQRPYCREILDRIRRIEAYTAAGREVSMESKLLQDGVIRNFEVIGEVAKRLDRALTERYPEIISKPPSLLSLIHSRHYLRDRPDGAYYKLKAVIRGIHPKLAL